MLGAIIGDIVGSPYEFSEKKKRKDFKLFSRWSSFTDDTVMTIAIADALRNVDNDAGKAEMEEKFVESMRFWGNRYNDVGYGGLFYNWLMADYPIPYGSFGNGSAMRVSSVGWMYDSLEQTIEVAGWTAEVTHNHPEGIKGAKATASAIWMARKGYSKDEIKSFIEKEFKYDLCRTCDEIRPEYKFDATCQGSVPESIIAFLESTDYEDCVRTAVSLGGDTDTMACIAGGIAEAFYGIPEGIIKEGRKRLSPDLRKVVDKFYEEVIKPGNGRSF